MSTGKYCVTATWDDCAHLPQSAREALWAEIPPYQREARTKGIPSLGAGAVYPIAVSDIVVPDFVPPKAWPRVYGMDVGWNWTAAVWLAWNKDTDTVYAYQVYKRGEAEPPVHAEAIKRRGSWIPGVIDPAAAGRSQDDGRRLTESYKGLGLNLTLADHALESGIFEVYTRLSAGRLKIFTSCAELIAEYSMYQRDSHGRIKTQTDKKSGDENARQERRNDALDALRYAIMSGLKRAIPFPVAQKPKEPEYEYSIGPGGGSDSALAWMGA